MEQRYNKENIISVASDKVTAPYAVGLGFMSISSGLRFHLYRRETDMRRSFDSLCGIIANELGGRLQEGDAYIFINKHHTHLKLIIRDKKGFSIFYHRLDKNTFTIPVFDIDCRSMQLGVNQLILLIENLRGKQ